MPYTNFNSTALSGDIAPGTTSIGVVDGSIFPTSNFNLLVEDELIFCTSRSSNTLTCVRGVDGSTAAAHASGTSVYLLLSGSYTNRNLITRNKLQAVFTSPSTGSDGSVISAGLVANLPAPSQEGNIFLTTDGVYSYFDTGVAMTPFGPTRKLVEPVNADFSWSNQGSGTVSTAYGGVYLRSPGQATESMCMRVKNAPATPYTITAGFTMNAISKVDLHAGIALRQSSDGKIATNTFASVGVIAYKYNTATSYNSSYVTAGVPRFNSTLMWLRVTDDGSNRILSWSSDGFVFEQYHTIGRTDFLTADQVGFYVNAKAAAAPTTAAIHLLHWEET